MGIKFPASFFQQTFPANFPCPSHWEWDNDRDRHRGTLRAQSGGETQVKLATA